MKTKLMRNLTKGELKTLRSEIVLNSLYIKDYENSFEIDSNIVCSFFEGYMDYLWELATEKYGVTNKLNDNDVINEYDNINNLLTWFNCYDTFGDENKE